MHLPSESWKRLVVAAFALLIFKATHAQEIYFSHSQWIDTHKVERITDISRAAGDSMDRRYTSTTLPHYTIAYDGDLYFRGKDSASGKELGRYDGNTTSLVTHTMPGVNRSAPEGFAVYDDDLYFTSGGLSAGRELMRYHGSTMTVAVDVAPGSKLRSTVGSNTVYDRNLYFRTSDGAFGSKIHRFYVKSISVPIEIISGAGGAGASSLDACGAAPSAFYCVGNAEPINSREVLRLHSAIFMVAAELDQSTKVDSTQEVPSRRVLQNVDCAFISRRMPAFTAENFGA